ncbi:DUF6751 family protein [Anaerosporobacter faecicola]|uniref:DUF6751 family protein n=1 Tax=Anaerosporobacter faecicola TaxID=2718714 RepID=UPI0014391A0F|nr:DUF6751 family protein [Anaerosporobacter faecicola]
MKNTVKVTIFHQGADSKYTKAVYDHCFWDEDQAQAIKKSGLSSVDSLYVSIPYTTVQSLDITKGKDYIIKGETDIIYDNTSQSTQSASLKDLKASHNVFTLNSISLKNHGSRKLWHWELSGK